MVERGRDRRLVQRIVEEVHRTPAIQTFPPVPIAQSRTVDREKETREVGITGFMLVSAARIQLIESMKCGTVEG